MQLASRCGLSNRKVPLTESVQSRLGKDPEITTEHGRERPCVVWLCLRDNICTSFPPRGAFVAKAGHAYYLRHAGGVAKIPGSPRRRRRAASGSTRYSTDSAFRSAAPGLSSCARTSERQPIRGQMYAGGVPNRPTLPTPLEPAGFACASAAGRSRRGRREQVRIAEVGRCR